MSPRDADEALGLVLLAVVLLCAVVAVLDGLRGTRSWREWFDRLR